MAEKKSKETLPEIVGTSNKLLEVNLSTKKSTVIEIDDKDREMYMGGKGLGLKLLYDRMEPGIDPLGEDNMIAFMMGVLMGTGAACSGRFSAVTKSPLTGIMVAASCGGHFGMALKTSGYDGLIIKGKAKTPTYLVIDSKGVVFKDAKKLWGKDTFQTQDAIKSEGTGIMAIGPAGENMVKYANICSGQRFLGRGGMGAVMGSKNLKAIVATGKEFKVVPTNKNSFDKTKKKLLKYINNNEVTSNTYRNFGTNANVMNCNAAGILPARNFTGGTHKDAYAISGENQKEVHDFKYHTCKPCSILCGHKGNYGGKTLATPEYETTALFGSNLEIFDTVKLAEINDVCSRIGVDTISAGGVFAWTMEATEKGLIDTNLKFGSTDGIIEMLKDISKRKGIGNDLAEGTRALSNKYGGKDFAIHVKGLEMAAYDPRGVFGQALSYATANRGACHLSTSIFAVEAFFNMQRPYAVRGKHHMVKWMENVTQAVNSMHICQFTAFPVELEPPIIKFSPTPVLNIFTTNLTAVAIHFLDISTWPRLWSAITGKKFGSGNFKKAGERIHVLERYMNTREGISKKDDTLPGRLLNEFRDCDSKKRTIPLEKMLKRYYRIRGFDKNGIPTDKTLKRLGIEKK